MNLEQMIHQGLGEIVIDHLNGKQEIIPFKNRIVDTGRAAIALSLANQFGGVYEFWVNALVFGSGGVVGGTPRYVDSSRNGLFGPTVATKAVIATINADIPSQVNFTTVLLYDDAVGATINEMGLKMKSGDFYSLATFGDISKSSSMQITLNWRISNL